MWVVRAPSVESSKASCPGRWGWERPALGPGNDQPWVLGRARFFPPSASIQAAPYSRVEGPGRWHVPTPCPHTSWPLRSSLAERLTREDPASRARGSQGPWESSEQGRGETAWACRQRDWGAESNAIFYFLSFLPLGCTRTLLVTQLPSLYLRLAF